VTSADRTSAFADHGMHLPAGHPCVGSTLAVPCRSTEDAAGEDKVAVNAKWYFFLANGCYGGVSHSPLSSQVILTSRSMGLFAWWNVWSDGFFAATCFIM